MGKDKPVFKSVTKPDFDRHVLDAYKAEQSNYGYPRLTLLLNTIGLKTNQYQVQTAMKRLNISSIIRVKKWIENQKKNKSSK